MRHDSRDTVELIATEFYSVTSSFYNFSIRTFEPHHTIYTAAVRTCAKFQIASINESEDREV